MRHVLACGINAVVAADTIPSDVDVIELRWNPGGRLVTVVALIAGRNVIRGLTGRGDAIVTGSAASRDCRMVHEGDRTPRGCCMTVRADVRRRDVIARFARCLNGAFLRVAADTHRNCVLELARCVAALAVYSGVRAIQLETGAEMVKGLLRDAVRCDGDQQD